MPFLFRLAPLVLVFGAALPALADSSAPVPGKPRPPVQIPPPSPEKVKSATIKPRALSSSPPELLLTFDDGPSLERTPKVLATLEKHHIHAVFFVNGMHFQGDSASAVKSRELLRVIVSGGHAVGNHTIHHYFLCGSRGPKVGEAEIEGNAALIEHAIGMRPELFRTPYGSRCKSLSKTLDKLGVKHTGWDIDPQDWKVQNTVKVRDYVIAHLKRFKSGREILLMHDIHADTVEALPQILDWLDKENLARIQRGEPPVRIIDYAYLLPPRPTVFPMLDGVGRVLLQQIPLPSPFRSIGRWMWTRVFKAPGS